MNSNSITYVLGGLVESVIITGSEVWITYRDSSDVTFGYLHSELAESVSNIYSWSYLTPWYYNTFGLYLKELIMFHGPQGLIKKLIQPEP